MVLRRARRQAPDRARTIIFRWDLDKTYLKSDFESLRELVRIPFEKPEDKVAVPGVVPLIRNLREGPGREVRIYFMSASPPQIAKAIREKIALDGIVYDGIVFKNQLQHLVRGLRDSRARPKGCARRGILPG
jgi:phosphatidate phosphatase APP1